MIEGLDIYVLAGGLGRRLGTISEEVPKSLIFFNDKPFIYYQLKFLEKNDVKRVTFCVGKHSAKIMDWVNDNWSGECKVLFSEDGEKLLGTGGAVKKALSYSKASYAGVMYGDTLLNFVISNAYKKFVRFNCTAMMTIFRNENQLDRSNIKKLGGNHIHYDKRNADTQSVDFIDYGFVYLNVGDFLRFERKVNFDLSEYLEEISDKGCLFGYEVNQRFFEIGSHEGIEEFKKLSKTLNFG